jgi:hypothetical protein
MYDVLGYPSSTAKDRTRKIKITIEQYIQNKHHKDAPTIDWLDCNQYVLKKGE